MLWRCLTLYQPLRLAKGKEPSNTSQLSSPCCRLPVSALVPNTHQTYQSHHSILDLPRDKLWLICKKYAQAGERKQRSREWVGNLKDGRWPYPLQLLNNGREPIAHHEQDGHQQQGRGCHVLGPERNPVPGDRFPQELCMR